jgi:hypothetical protein
MASQVEICNLALIRLGESKITTLSDNSKAAILLSSIWDLIKDEVLQAHSWNFAVLRAQLEAEETAPDWGYAYEYPLPGDCLRFLGINDDPDIEYRLEAGVDGKSVFCDEGSPINVKYVTAIDDPELFDPNFVNALGWRLAGDLAFPLTANANLVNAMMGIYQRSLPTAKTLDSQEDSGQLIECPAWVDARR